MLAFQVTRLSRGLVSVPRRVVRVPPRSRVVASGALGCAFESLGHRAVEKMGEDVVDARLFVVPTPLGEVSDLTFRSVAALAAADVIACEDTRRAGALFAALGISREERGVFVRHDLQTASRSSPKLIEAMLSEGKVVALISDAGTPRAAGSVSGVVGAP